MAHTTLQNNAVISLDSLDNRLILLNNTLLDQITLLIDQNNQQQKIIQQLKVANIYKSYETDIIITPDIFDSEEDN